MKVELSIHAMNLKNVAGAFKGTSDPFAVVTKMATTPGVKPEVLGKTEVVKNNLSPKWAKVFVLDYELGTPTKVAINLYDEVRKGDNKSMGSALFDIGELLGARGNTKARKLKGGGTIFAMVRKAKGSGLLRLKMRAHKLKNVEGMFSKSDPFFELSRQINAAGGLTWDIVYRSKPIKNNLNPVWEICVIELGLLCGGDLDSPIKIALFDHESSGKHIPMGTVEMSVNGMQNASHSQEKIKILQKGKDVGMLEIVAADVTGRSESGDEVTEISERITQTTKITTNDEPEVAVTAGPPNFIDYISGGCELNVVVAIDFTGSNGDPRIPGTLHHIDKNGRNPYEKAISAILSILSKYDSDQKFPVLGFGAKYGGVIRHAFQCGPTEEVQGVSGVLDAYHSVFASGLVMSGPTVFTEVMEVAAARAQSELEQAQRNGTQSYTILLILTDGAVSDAQATARCLDRISVNPLSVVIVGVGDADFSAMQFLDDASAPGKRDIAQFVEFNKHSSSSTALTSETLREIPDQLVQYFQKKGIPPMPPMERSDSMMSIGEAEDEIDLSLDVGEEEIVITRGGTAIDDGFASGFGR